MMELTSDDYTETEPYKEIVSEVLSEYGEEAENVEDFHMYSTAGFQYGDEFRLSMVGYSETGAGDIESIRSVYMISLEDYNRLTGESREMADDELLLYPFKADYNYDRISSQDSVHGT